MEFVAVDAAELEYRARTMRGCVPPQLVSRLVELGHVGVVEELAGRGEWFCAVEWVRVLVGRGRRDVAVEVLGPYVGAGWWTAVEELARLLEEWGLGTDAVALVRPHAEGGGRLALAFFARLLGRYGQGAEAFELLRPHVSDWFFADALVDVSWGAGLEEEAALLLSGCIDAVVGHGSSCGSRRILPSNAVRLLAAIRERQGRVDEAVELLRTWGGASVNGRDQLAELLVRQERIAELHEYAATEHHGQAAECLAEYLERLGDVEGAIAVYRRPGDSSSRRVNGLMRLAQLLTRHGRDDEAAEVLLSLAESAGGELDWKVELLCRHYLDQGRALDGLAYLDDLRGRRGGEEWDIFRMRLPLMVGCGRREEAIELVRGHPERDTSYGAGALAELLAGAGRTDEAVAVLQRQESGVASTLAGYLIDLGRVEDAIAVLRGEDRAAGSVAPGVR